MANDYSKIKTLIVEDDRFYRRDLEKIARDSGLSDINLASSETEAEEYLIKNQYNLLLLDSNRSGIKMGEIVAVKALSLGQKPKIIALSLEEYMTPRDWEESGIEHTFFGKIDFSAKDLVPILEEIVKK